MPARLAERENDPSVLGLRADCIHLSAISVSPLPVR